MDWEEFINYYGDYDFNRRLLILDENPEFVTNIIDDKISDLYTELAKLESTPSEFLEFLSKSRQRNIRFNLLQNKNAPKDFVEKAFNSVDRDISKLAAVHPKLSKDFLMKFINKNNTSSPEFIRKASILSNPNLPEVTIDYIFSMLNKSESSLYLRYFIEQPNLKPHMVRQFIRTLNKEEKSAMLRNINPSSEIISDIITVLGGKYILDDFPMNRYFKTNSDMRKMCLDLVDGRYDNSTYLRFFTKVGAFLTKSEIEELYSKKYQDRSILMPIIGNINCPTKYVIELLQYSSKYDVYKINLNIKFSQNELLSFMKYCFEHNVFSMAESFYGFLKKQFAIETETALYDLTGDDSYLPKSVKDVFLF